MWRETYATVLRESAQDGGACAAQKLLAAVASAVDLSASDAVAVKAQLSAIGRELVAPLDDVLTLDSRTPRREKLSLFKLQAVARLLVCCEDDVFGDEDESSKSQRRGKAKKNKKGKKSKTTAKMSVRSELRELLDRVALLIDSANPPSIADSEDEPPPFHVFLLNVLQRQLGSLLPSVFSVIREVYEVADIEEEHVLPPVALSTFATKESLPVADEPVEDSTCILSALKDKRPSKKRSLAATSEHFKEVILPGQLKKTSSLKPRAHKDEKSTQSTHDHSSVLSASKTNKRPASDSSLVSLAAASKKSKSSRPTTSLLPKAVSIPMLVRNVDRKVLPGRNIPLSVPGLSSVPGLKGVPSLARPTQASRGTIPNVAQLSRASVVMRTPDRPQRSQRAQPRILVEASPPLRNPFATARLRRPGPHMPK